MSAEPLKERSGKHFERKSSLVKYACLQRMSRFALGSRISHPTRGLGTVTEHMADGRTKVKFAAGDEHRYRRESITKLLSMRDLHLDGWHDDGEEASKDRPGRKEGTKRGIARARSKANSSDLGNAAEAPVPEVGGDGADALSA